MNALFLVSGLPGAGKSTVANKLAKRLGGTMLDIDVFKKEVVDPNLVTKEIDPPAVRRLYYERATQAALQTFHGGARVVVMEEVFHLAHLRDEITIACEQGGAAVFWIEVVCPFRIVEARLMAKGREGHILSTKQSLEMYLAFGKVFEPLILGSARFRIENIGSDSDLDSALGRALDSLAIAA